MGLPVIHLDRPSQSAFTGWSGEAVNYAGLPSAASVDGQFWMVLNATGSRFIFTYKASGLYLSESGSWRKINNAQLLLNDDQFSVYNSADNTKQIAFDVSAIATGTKRTATWPNKDGTVAMLSDIVGATPTLSQVVTSGNTLSNAQVMKALNGGGQINFRAGADGYVCISSDNEALITSFLKLLSGDEVLLGLNADNYISIIEGEVFIETSDKITIAGDLVNDLGGNFDIGDASDRFDEAWFNSLHLFNSFDAEIVPSLLTASRQYNLQDKSGTLAHLDDIISIIPQSFSFTRNNNDFLQENNGAYQSLCKITYGGTDLFGIHTNIITNAWNDGGTSISIEIFDTTNGNQIAEVTGITSASIDNIVNLGTLTNLPTGQAVFEVRVLLVGGGMGDQAKISSLTIY